MKREQVVSNQVASRTFGQNPGLVRTWGDGVGRNRPHIIEGISFTEGHADCGPCGVRIMMYPHLTLEDAWNFHRGAQVRPTVYKSQQLATDSDVREFLRKLDEPGWEPTPTRLVDVAFRPDHV